MNIELLKKTRDQIAAEPERFDYNHFAYQSTCGTTGCVAGHIAAIHGWAELGDLLTLCCLEIEEKAIIAADLDDEIADWLFWGPVRIVEDCDSTSGRAWLHREALRRLDWLIAGKDFRDYEVST